MNNYNAAMSEAPMSLRRLTPDQVDEIYPIHEACAADLGHRFGAGHWAQGLPIEQYQRRAQTKHLYGVWREGVVEAVATFTLSRQPPSFFDLSQFRFPDDPAAYLTSLAVRPELQGQGIGRWCMGRIEELAVNWSCRAVRFDAYDAPAGASAFYRKCGYQARGTLTFRDISLILFEKTMRSRTPCPQERLPE